MRHMDTALGERETWRGEGGGCALQPWPGCGESALCPASPRLLASAPSLGTQPFDPTLGLAGGQLPSCDPGPEVLTPREAHATQEGRTAGQPSMGMRLSWYLQPGEGARPAQGPVCRPCRPALPWPVWLAQPWGQPLRPGRGHHCGGEAESKALRKGLPSPCDPESAGRDPLPTLGSEMGNLFQPHPSPWGQGNWALPRGSPLSLCVATRDPIPLVSPGAVDTYPVLPSLGARGDCPVCPVLGKLWGRGGRRGMCLPTVSAQQGCSGSWGPRTALEDTPLLCPAAGPAVFRSSGLLRTSTRWPAAPLPSQPQRGAGMACRGALASPSAQGSEESLAPGTAGLPCPLYSPGLRAAAGRGWQEGRERLFAPAPLTSILCWSQLSRSRLGAKGQDRETSAVHSLPLSIPPWAGGEQRAL